MIRRFSGLSVSWLLPIILALIPLFILARGAGWERQQTLRAQEDRWLRSVDRGSRWLKKAGEASYWVGLTSRRFQSFAHKSLAKSLVRDQFPSRQEIHRAAVTAARNMHPAGMPRCQIFVLPMIEDTSLKRPEILEGAGLSSKPKRLMTEILSGIAEGVKGNTSVMLRQEFQNKLELSFGFGVSGELFSDTYRGYGIPTIFGKQYGNLVWNTISFRNRPVAVFILISPLIDIQQKKLARLSLLHFSRILPRTPLSPVFLPFQAWREEKPPTLYVNHSVRFSSGLLLARNMQKKIGSSLFQVGNPK